MKAQRCHASTQRLTSALSSRCTRAARPGSRYCTQHSRKGAPAAPAPSDLAAHALAAAARDPKVILAGASYWILCPIEQEADEDTRAALEILAAARESIREDERAERNGRAK